MELAVVDLPGVRLLVHVRREDTHLVRLGDGDRCAACHEDPVDGLRPRIRLESARLLTRGLAVVENICRLHACRRYGEDRNLVVGAHLRIHCARLEVRNIKIARYILCPVENRAYRRRHDEDERLILADDVLDLGDLLIELTENVVFAWRKCRRLMRCALCKCCDLAVAVGIDLRRNLQPLELAHDASRRGDKVALIHIHRVELERTPAILRERVILVSKSYRTLIESVVAVILCKSRRGNARHAHRVAAVILHIRGICLHPAGRARRKHLLVEFLLENLCHLKCIDCHVSLLLFVSLQAHRRTALPSYRPRRYPVTCRHRCRVSAYP